MVAKHLNQNCSYPRHSYVLDSNGLPIVETLQFTELNSDAAVLDAFPRNAGTQGIFQMSQADVLDLRVANVTNTNGIIVCTLNINVLQLNN